MKVTRLIKDELLKSAKYSLPITAGIAAYEASYYYTKKRVRAIRTNKKILPQIEKQMPVYVTHTHPLPTAGWFVPGQLTEIYDKYQKIKKELKRKDINPVKKRALLARKKLYDYFWGLNKIKMTPWDRYKDWRNGAIIVDKRVYKSSVFPIVAAYEEGKLNRQTRGLSYTPELLTGIGIGSSLYGYLSHNTNLIRAGKGIALVGAIGSLAKEILITHRTIKDIKKMSKSNHTDIPLAVTNIARQAAGPVLNLTGLG